MTELTPRPRVRVFLLTYRRPMLLARAIASLRAQSFTAWTCELHNDDPDDRRPGELLKTIGDPRFQLCDHPQNWGAVRSFNHAYAGGPEEFGSILEDDNWWEPTFLEEILAVLSANPAAALAWSNMRIWRENADGSWTDTGRTVWRTDPTTLTVDRPEPIQLSDAVHSQGAMVFRSRPSREALVPLTTPLAIIEPIRERLLRGNLLFIAKPLANFAVTLQTSRAVDRVLWAQSQLIVAASYIGGGPATADEIDGIWESLRAQQPPSTPLLFHLALAGIEPWQILKRARSGDWVRFLAGAVRHPLTLLKILRFRHDHRELWERLTSGQARRSTETLPERVRPAIFTKNAP